MPEFEQISFGSAGDEPYVGYARRNGPYTMSTNHFHPYYEMYVLLSGERNYFIRDRTYRVKPGDLVLIGKHELHKTLDGSTPEHERLLIHFHDSFVHTLAASQAKWLLAPFQRDVKVIRPVKPELTLAPAERMLKELRERSPGNDIALKLSVLDLLLAAARHTHADEPAAGSRSVPSAKDKTTDIIRYINEAYSEPLTLGLLADRYFVSPWHLSRIFKEATGFSLTDYISLTRVKEAQRLLRETDRSITEVAANVGFDNFSHFGKTFKKITGLTPRDYRKKARP